MYFMIDPLLNNRGAQTSNINDFLINVGKIARREIVREAGADAFAQNVSTMQALVNQANIPNIKVQFADVLDQGQLGQEVYGSRLSKSLIISSISDSTLKEFDLPEISSARGYHIAYDIGSEEHKAVLGALKKEKISRSVLKKATTADQFIMLNPNSAFSGTDQLSLLSNAKTVFHEIGHGFSSLGRYDGSLDFDRLANMAKIVRDRMGTDGYENALNNFKQSHIQYMRMRAIEEARAESFAHSMIARVGKSVELGQAATESTAGEFDVMYKTVSYSHASAWKSYEAESFDILKKYIGEDAFRSEQMSEFKKGLVISGRTEAEKTFFTGIDSGILTEFNKGPRQNFIDNMYSIKLKYPQQVLDYYVGKMGQLFDGSLGRKIGESGIVQITSRGAAPVQAMAAQKLLPAAAASRTSSRIINRNANCHENSWSSKII